MIFDYLHEHADLDFETLSLNVLDLLVLAELAYFEYPERSWGEPLPSALEQATHFTGSSLNEGHPRFVDLGDEDDQKLSALVQDASRYAQVQLIASSADYVEESHQFSGTAFKLDDVLILAFRGTDETLTGWQEALELSLEEPGTGRLLAKRFFEEQAAATRGPIIACGHSKGGNFAVYSALSAAADPIISDRIAAVLSFDGPGYSPSMREDPAYPAIGSRTSAYIPKSSIIGNIHEYPEGAITYVQSKEVFMAQHVIYSWETAGTHFISCRQSLMGKLGSGALNLLIDNLDDRQKQIVINTAMKVPALLARLK